MKKRAFGVVLAAAVLAACISGCSSQSTKDTTDYYSPSVLGFEIPGAASVDDFTWLFSPRDYDSSLDKPLSNPYGVVGVWEYVNEHKPDKKSGYQKDVYWMSVTVVEKSGKMLSSSSYLDPSIAAEVYGFQAYNESEEAQNSGLVGSETTGKLIEALSNLDGGDPCHVTMIQVGVEDVNGNWKDITNAKPIEFDGKYYPDHLFLKVEDVKGNRLTINDFVDNGTIQHAFATNENPKQDMLLYGRGGLYRKIK